MLLCYFWFFSTSSSCSFWLLNFGSHNKIVTLFLAPIVLCVGQIFSDDRFISISSISSIYYIYSEEWRKMLMLLASLHQRSTECFIKHHESWFVNRVTCVAYCFRLLKVRMTAKYKSTIFWCPTKHQIECCTDRDWSTRFDECCV